MLYTSKSNLKANFHQGRPLYLQVAESIVSSINSGELKVGDKIPSINKFSEDYLLSRDTVEKAYKELLKDRVIYAVTGKGCFVKRVDIKKNLRVLLIFNKLSNYKKQVYNSIIQTLSDQATVDLSIHHSNAQILDSIIKHNLGNYDYYLIAAHFYCDREQAYNAIKQLPPEKVILLDKTLPEMNFNYSSVYQDYEKDIYQALHAGLSLLKRYKKMILVFPMMSNYPEEIARGFKLFCICNSFDYEIIKGIKPSNMISSGDAYIVIEETDLADLIKGCNCKQLKIGEEVGIISYNDTPLKEILLEGITVMSTDHDLMGKTAASIILSGQRQQFKNPFSLITRRSL